MNKKAGEREGAPSARALFEATYGRPANRIAVEAVPGRVNLIGEHIDYHLLPVLPMAIDRAVTVAFTASDRGAIRAVSTHGKGPVEVSLRQRQQPGSPGDWSNYIKAAVNAIGQRWPLALGLDAAVVADLPVAAGLSSSSALLSAFAIALLRVNGFEPRLDELMEVLPEGEQFVGTRGGSMDHAAVLAGRAGCALHLQFAPLKIEPVPVPARWAFLVAHTLQTAEKSGAVREKYNALREAGRHALQERGYASFAEALARGDGEGDDGVYRHVLTESARVAAARRALLDDDLVQFGGLLVESHGSLRDRLGVSTPAADALVESALAAGATGARLTGAGFGGCVLVACDRDRLPSIRARLQQHYAGCAAFQPEQHLFVAGASAGALFQ